jgi:guanylate kinase
LLPKSESKIIIIISSPSGAGKTTVTKKLLKKIKSSYLSVSCTTRKPRPGEIDGVDYYFINNSKFMLLKKQGKFLETAKIFENNYGTLKTELKKKKYQIMFLDIDWQGARSIRRKIKDNCYSFYLLPPNRSQLKKRLLSRHKQNKLTALKRFSAAKKDITYWKEYNSVFINDNLEDCLKKIINKINNLIEEFKEKNKVKKLVKSF